MNDLETHVNHLFKGYTNSPQNNDLKAEILSNLEAKKKDLINSGMDESTAVQQTRDTLTSLDGLIEETKSIYIGRYMLEVVQTLLLYLLVAWIVSIPLTIMGFWKSHELLLKCVIVIGTGYLIASLIGHLVLPHIARKNLGRKAVINLDHMRRIRRYTWGIWLLFIILFTLILTGAMFGSNIWYSRLVVFNGPYEFAMTMLTYLEPFFTIVIPLTLHKLPGLVQKHEAQIGENHEI
ncbi:MAG: permease prefix domain 1-containing protein [Peptococcaceae bacterium]|nr:permease prefix domain 1-containing protein [Peptococcaceae bacterium]